MSVTNRAAAESFVQNCFPNQYLIPIKEYSVVMSESYGAVRNRIAAGTFELPLVKKGSRNFITAPDLVELLCALQPGQTIEASEPEPASPRVKEEEEGTTTRRPKYGFEARSRAAASKKKRQAQAAKARAAKSTTQKNEEVAA